MIRNSLHKYAAACLDWQATTSLSVGALVFKRNRPAKESILVSFFLRARFLIGRRRRHLPASLCPENTPT